MWSCRVTGPASLDLAQLPAEPGHGLVKGRLVRSDSFWAYFRHIKQRVQKTIPSFEGTPKGLRKMSATLLASHPTYGRYDQYFLGHAPSSVADRHYVRPDQAAFDEAVTWLGRQLGQVE